MATGRGAGAVTTLDPAVQGALQAGLVLVLGMALCHKLRDFAGFRAAVENYRLLPARLVPPELLRRVGVAAGTRKDDIVVDAGAPILLMLTTPFVM